MSAGKRVEHTGPSEADAQDRQGDQDFRDLHGPKDFPYSLFPFLIEKILAPQYQRTPLLKSIGSLYFHMKYGVILYHLIYTYIH